MKRRLLIVVSSDPRASHRPAEAVRLAAGLGAWGKIETSLLLLGPALLGADSLPDEWVDGHLFAEQLPLIPAQGGRIYFEAGNALRDVINPAVPLEAVSPERLAKLVREMDCSMDLS